MLLLKIIHGGKFLDALWTSFVIHHGSSNYNIDNYACASEDAERRRQLEQIETSIAATVSKGRVSIYNKPILVLTIITVQWALFED